MFFGMDVCPFFQRAHGLANGNLRLLVAQELYHIPQKSTPHGRQGLAADFQASNAVTVALGGLLLPGTRREG